MGSGPSKKAEVSPYLIQCFPEAHDGGVNCLTISKDRTMIATGGEDCTAKVWHIAVPNSEQLKCVCKGHKGYITSLQIFDEFLVTASEDKTLRKWDIDNDGEFILEYSGHTSMINEFILTEDYLLSSSYDKTIRWWQFVTGECLKVFQGHKRSVTPLLFLPAKDHNDAETGEDAQEDDSFISGSSDGTARLWSLENANCVRTFAGHENAVLCLAVESTHEVLFTGSTDGTIRSWVIDTGENLKIYSGHAAPVLQIQILNKLMFSASSDWCAKCWVTEFGDCTRTYKGHKHSVLCFTLKDSIIYTGCGDGLLRAFDIKSGTQKRVFGGHGGAINSIVITDTGRIFTGSNDGCLIIWDSIGIKSDKELREERKRNAAKDSEAAKDTDNNRLNSSATSRSSMGSSQGGGKSPEVAIDIDQQKGQQNGKKDDIDAALDEKFD